jgi:hypothetical protein
MKRYDLKGMVPESWGCIDCGINTAPGCPNRQQAEEAAAGGATSVWNDKDKVYSNTFDELSEVYAVKRRVWEAAGMAKMDGCLCIGCLERRLGRTLIPEDFMRRHPFSTLTGTARLLARRDG